MSDEQVAALEAALAARDKDLAKERVANAFLSIADHKWRDKEIALAQADLSECVGEDGSVDIAKVEKAARALAFEKPFLVHTILDEPLLPSQPSGLPVGSGRKYPGGPPLNEELLRKKYGLDRY